MSRRPGLTVGLAMLLIATAACGSAPAPSPDPAALPLDYAIVWDVPGSTAAGGRGPYFLESNARRLSDGWVLVTWWCSGSGTLSVVAGHVDHPPELPSPQSPIAFRMACPTGGSSYVGWGRLLNPAEGGENALDIRPVASPSANITYRIIFAQRNP
jgi:hypothetical protein